MHAALGSTALMPGSLRSGIQTGKNNFDRPPGVFSAGHGHGNKKRVPAGRQAGMKVFRLMTKTEY